MIGNTHALGLATKGIMAGHTIGLSSQGYLVKIFEYVYVPPEPEPTRPGSPGSGRDIPRDEQKKKVVRITVTAYGKKFISEHIVDENVRVGVKDVDIVDDGTQVISVRIKDVNK